MVYDKIVSNCKLVNEKIKELMTKTISVHVCFSP